MPRDYAREPRTKIKRRDRAVTDESWIKEFLRVGHWGALATVHDGQPFIHTNLFVYDERRNAIYTHTARFGRTSANLDEPAPACFAVSSMGRVLPAPTAVDFSVEYEQVTVFGDGAVVRDVDEAYDALKALLLKYAPHLTYGDDYGAITKRDMRRTTVFRIDIQDWSAKRKVADDEFTGGYCFPYSDDSVQIRRSLDGMSTGAR